MIDPKRPKLKKTPAATGYDVMLSGVVELLEQARRTSARAVNTIMTATYWEVGRRIVEHEQGGKGRAQYGTQLLERLSVDLGKRFGRGFSIINIRSMRKFYECWPIRQTISVESGTSQESIVNFKSRLKNPMTGSQLVFRFPGRNMSDLCRLKTRKHAHSMKQSHCAAAGVCHSSTARFPRSSMSERRFPATRRPC